MAPFFPGNILLLGAPGSGKGFVSFRLQELYPEEVVHLSSGQVFRKHVENQTNVGKKVEAVLKSGALVEDDLTFEVLRAEVERRRTFQRNGDECSDGSNGGSNGSNAEAYPTAMDGSTAPVFLFDGAVRTRAQAEKFSSNVADLAVVIQVVAPQEEIAARIRKREAKDGRADDDVAVWRKRMEDYEEKVSPILDYYRDDGTAPQLWTFTGENYPNLVQKGERSEAIVREICDRLGRGGPRSRADGEEVVESKL